MAFMAGKAVTQVVHRCEAAKVSGNLDLSGCSLTCVPNAVYFILKGFEIYSCSLKNNVLKSFPKKLIEKFPNMTVFSIEKNAIEEIPNEIAEWTALRGINLSKNKLTTFPEALYGLKQLSILDLSDNAIQNMDVNQIYKSFPSLTQLNVAGNPISDEQEVLLSSCGNKPKFLNVILNKR